MQSPALKLHYALFAALFFVFLVPPASAAFVVKAPTALGTVNGLVGHWSFDGPDINWATGAVTDSSGNGNTGTLVGNISTTTAPRVGKLGQALSFDGVDEGVNVGDLNAVDGIGALTISAWVKQESAIQFAGIVTKRDLPTTSNSLEFAVGGSGVGGSDDVFLRLTNGGPDAYGYTTSDILKTGVWVHLTAVFDGSQSGDNAATLKIYADGVAQTVTFEGTIPASTSAGNENPLWIGALEGNGNGGGLGDAADIEFSGLIDDVRIYNRVLSEAEIKRLYNLGAKTKTYINTSVKGILSDGLVGHWSFDGQDTDWGTNTTNDVSGNGNHGTLTNMNITTSPKVGKLGQALEFDGSDDYVKRSVANFCSGCNVGTGTAWVKTTSASGGANVFSSSDEASDDDRIQFVIRSGKPAIIQQHGDPRTTIEADSVTVSDGIWHHLAFMSNGSEYFIYVDGSQIAISSVEAGGANDGDWFADITVRDNILIGALERTSVSGYFDGLIDDVRIYDRALSADEVRKLYELGTEKHRVVVHTPTRARNANGLVGHWSFDGQDTDWGTNTTNDVSGNGNHGTMTNMNITTSPKVGKLGQALDFDGSDDYVDAGDIDAIDGIAKLTIAAWVKRDFSAKFDWIVGKNQDPCCSTRILLGSGGDFGLGSTDDLLAVLKGNGSVWTTDASYIAGVWHHVVMVFDGTLSGNTNRVKLFINGVQRSTDSANTVGATTPSTDVPFIIGRDQPQAGGEFPGLIDDVRIYNRALSVDEVRQLYNRGR